MFERIRSLPDWVWFLCLILFVLIFGLIEDAGYPRKASTTPLSVSIIMACFFAYMYPGWRLARHVDKRFAQAWWHEYASVIVLFAWCGVPYVGAKIIEGRTV